MQRDNARMYSEKYILDVACKLNVSLGEEFDIRDCGENYTIDLEYGVLCNDCSQTLVSLEDLENGKCSIIKKPFKPKFLDWYYCINENGNIVHERWENTITDLLLYKVGNCFKKENEISGDRIERYLKFLNDNKVENSWYGYF